jgi:hypothetical protein
VQGLIQHDFSIGVNVDAGNTVSGSLVPRHAYALEAYNRQTHTATLRNPWNSKTSVSIGLSACARQCVQVDGIVV